MRTTPADILNLIYSDLEEWAKPQRGMVSLTNNPYDLMNMFAEQPSGWRITVYWEGDAPADPRVRDVVVVENRFRIILDGNLGPTAVPKISLIRKTAARTPFLDLVSEVRKRVMAYQFPWLNEPNNRCRYRGADERVPLADGFAIAAYNLSFSLFSTIHQPEQTVELSHV